MRPTAGLLRNVNIPFTRDTIFVNHNRTLQDNAWSSDELSPDAGVVAITDEEARFKGLPGTMRFPWDHSKGIYFVNGFHNLHCLVGTNRSPNSISR